MPTNTDSVVIASTSPDLFIDYTGSDGVTNQKNWRLHGAVNTLVLGMRSDDNSQGSPALTFVRSGMTITGMYAPVPLTVSGVVMDQDGVVNVGAAGADLTGNADASAIVQQCLNLIAAKGGGVLLFPAGSTVRLNTGVNFNANVPLTIRSPGSRKGATIIQGPNCANLFVIDGTNLPTAYALDIDIENLQITNYRAGGCAFLIKNVGALRISNITGGGVGGGYWGEFCHLENLATSTIENFYVTNCAVSGKADIRGIAFNLVSTHGGTDNRFRNCVVACFNVGINANNNSTPGVEGIVCEGCAIIACNTGVVYASGSYAPPMFQYLNGHIDVYESLIILSNVAQVDFSHNDLYIDNTYGDANTPIRLTSVQGFKISDNFVVETGTQAGASGRNVAVMYIDGSSNWGLVHDMKFGLSNANCLVVLGPQTSNCDVHNVSGSGQPGVGAYSDSGRANLVNSTSVRMLT